MNYKESEKKLREPDFHDFFLSKKKRSEDLKF